MATWLIVLISIYCGAIYAIAILATSISDNRFRIRDGIELLFAPLILLWMILKGIFLFIKNKW